MQTSELAATMPAVVESSAQRLTWQREIENAKDEQGLIDEQIESLRRINALSRDEAERIFHAREMAARQAMDREFSDADKVMEAGIRSLRQRHDDLARIVTGLEAAVGATE